MTAHKHMQMYPCPHCNAEFDAFRVLEHHLIAAHAVQARVATDRCTTCDDALVSQMTWLDQT